MVLQRDTKLTIWGWAARGEKVSVKFKGKTYKTTASTTGDWLLTLPAMPAGGPYTMDIDASNHIRLSDILIGDVWFCSGQSNMTVKMERVSVKYPEEIAKANYPDIRYFFVPTLADVQKIHADLPPGKWVPVTAPNMLDIGAVPYFFAKQLYEKYHIPIGLINSSVGGTLIQAWTSEDGLKQVPKYSNRITQLKDSAILYGLMHPQKLKATIPINPQIDKGMVGPKKWFDTTYVPEGWHSFWLPGYLEDQGVSGLKGVVWFRKEIDLPAWMAGKPAMLFMGRIIDADVTYVNGVVCGNTPYQWPPRRYPVPAGVLKAGKNIIVVKVSNQSLKGGFVPEKPYYIAVDGTHVDIRGDWQYKVGQVYDNDAPNMPVFSAQNEPAGLYNTMVAPAVNYKIRGFLWYQGESNVDSGPKEYGQLLPALINDWRSKWGQGDLPFLYVQLPNYNEARYSPGESGWAGLREAELKTLALPNTGMAVAIDVGEWNDIHPLNKKDVGERLALWAQKLAYGDDKVVASGPLYQSAKVDGDKIVISFSNTGSGLVAKGGGQLEQFAIAGADKRFVWATAVISGNTVVVFNENIPQPMYVRYAWADNPEGALLYNKEGLPASPFRTDGQ